MENYVLYIFVSVVLVLVLTVVCKSWSDKATVSWEESRDRMPTQLTKDDQCPLSDAAKALTMQRPDTDSCLPLPSSSSSSLPALSSSSSSSVRLRSSQTGCKDCHRKWKDCLCTVILYRHDVITYVPRTSSSSSSSNLSHRYEDKCCSDLQRKIEVNNDSSGVIWRTPLIPIVKSKPSNGGQQHMLLQPG